MTKVEAAVQRYMEAKRKTDQLQKEYDKLKEKENSLYVLMRGMSFGLPPESLVLELSRAREEMLKLIEEHGAR